MIMSDTQIKEGVNQGDAGLEAMSVPIKEPRKAINAINWSLGLKIYHSAIPCFLAFLM
jgi:hypothetical protein